MRRSVEYLSDEVLSEQHLNVSLNVELYDNDYKVRINWKHEMIIGVELMRHSILEVIANFKIPDSTLLTVYQEYRMEGITFLRG